MMEENICGARDRIKGEEEEEAIVLPGFRFHPTDEELVGFYLLRKVEGKCINTHLITQLDIYKYDPWDLPKVSSSTGEKERYFYCRRGRKYPNSVRPNRVTLTGSGFWKATGIDKPIHSSNCSNKCIGLKKSLVYYRGNAGKGMKTDWMMHEFRLPSGQSDISNQEAEVWTLCRIFQRNNASHKKSKPDWKHTTNNKISVGYANSTKCSGFEYVGIRNGEHNIAFQGEEVIRSNLQEIRSQDLFNIPDEIPMAPSPMASSSSSLWTANGDDIFRKGGWDELGSVIGLAIDRSL